MSISQTSQNERISYIIFPQWTDVDVNNEKWDTGPKKDVKKNVQKKTNAGSTESLTKVEQVTFNDTQTFQLPNTINNAVEWKRPEELFENVEIILTNGAIQPSELRIGSTHILHSELIRNLISSVSILEYISYNCPWQIEAANTGYVPNTENQIWKPWHHIYALCKAGKGQQHNPKYNPQGKYIVRLFWMGYWRKIYVDDLLPVDSNGKVLLPGYTFVAPPPEPEKPPPLPSTAKGKEKKGAKGKKSKKDSGSQESKKSKKSKDSKGTKGKKEEKPPKPQYEIWPLILSKALLKIAALTWTEDNDVVDFSSITCLTGWVHQKLSVTDMSAMDVWKVCEAYSPKFLWEEDKLKEGTKTSKSDKSKSGKSDKSSKGSKKSSKGSKKESKKGSKKGKTDEADVPEEEDITKLYCLIGCCQDVKSLVNDVAIENLPPHWTQDILIEQFRDIPLLKPEPRPELARWKRFRWIKWAIGKGLWPADDLSLPIRCLKFFSNLNKGPEGDAPPAIALALSKSKSKDKKGKGKGKGKGKAKKGELKVFPVIDKSLWIDFSQIQERLESLSIFFRPSAFTSVVRVSDTFPLSKPSAGAKDKGKKDAKDSAHSWQDIGMSSLMKSSRNEVIHVHLNNLGPKLLIINLSQCGFISRLIHGIDVDEPFAYTVLEQFTWSSNRLGQISTFLNTNGTKTALTHLKPGKTLCRLWIKSNTNYVLSLLSNTQIVSGSLDDILDDMTQESLLLSKLTQEVSSSFGKLVNSFGTATFLESSRQFHQSYKPIMPLTKKDKQQLYKEFLSLLMELVPDGVLIYALKVLFLDNQLSMAKTHEKRSTDVFPATYEMSNLSQTDSVDMIKIREMAAVKLQSFFKYLYDRKLFNLHKQTNSKYFDIYERLKKIYMDVFSVPKRNSCMKLLRNLYLSSNLLKHSEITEDLAKTINIKTFKGIAYGLSWTFLTRQTFVVISPDGVKIKMCLFSNLSQYILRVFDNDTFEEMHRFTNNTNVKTYESNQLGYTILCYGYTKEALKVTWKLSMVYIKEPSNTLSINDDTPTVSTISEIYRPNVHSLVARCVLEVGYNTYITIRMSTTGKFANLELRLLDEDDHLIAKIKGQQNIILPIAKIGTERRSSSIELTKEKKGKTSSAKLKSFTSRKSYPHIPEELKSYYIEAAIDENSWPLTMTEWLTVKLEKRKFLMYPPQDDQATLSRTSGSEETITSLSGKPRPFWQLEVVHNSKDMISLHVDNTRRDQINEIKRGWYHSDPSRRTRSMQIRDEYLKEICGTACDICSISQEIVYGVMSDHSVQSDAPLLKWIPETMMMPQFTLCEYYNDVWDDDEEPIYPETDEWEQFLRDQSEEEMLYICGEFFQCQERMEKLLDYQMEQFVHVREWYDVLRQDSENMMKKAYDAREKYIDMMIAESQAAVEKLQPKDNTTKGDKEKKKEKGKKKNKK